MDYSAEISRKIDSERLAQISAGRQLAAQDNQIARPRRTTVSVAPNRTGAPAKKTLKGHEAFLKALEMSGANVVLEKASSGHIYYGKLKHSDKFTVTVNVIAIDLGEGAEDVTPIERVIFKSDISEFYTTTPPAHRPEAA